MTPLVSVVIPAYNAARWIEDTISSALAQTHAQIEVIVIDDGSSDDTLTLARTFADRGVCVIHQTNAGAAAARNHGLRLAQGQYIQFLDADDLLAPEKISRQLECLGADQGLVAAGPWGRFEHDPATATFLPEENWCDSDPVGWLAANFAGRGMMPPVAWLTPRGLIDRAGPWDERLSLNDDGEYFCRVLLKSKGVRFVPHARSFYRTNVTGSLSRSHQEHSWRSALLSQELCASHLLAQEDSPRTRQACADLLQRLAYAAWPQAPAVTARAETLASEFGGSRIRPGGGRGFQLAARLLGWKFARRIQHRRASVCAR